jgi:hypothetical protein
MPNLNDTPNFKEMTVAEKVKYFKDKQEELVAAEANLQTLSNLNKAELQMAFGLTPGKPVSIVDLVHIVADLVGEVAGPGALANKEEVDAISAH